LSLAFGLGLMLVWAGATALVYLAGLPPVLAKAALGVCALAWAVHVIRVAAANRRD
jgi:hypothetical protein